MNIYVYVFISIIRSLSFLEDEPDLSCSYKFSNHFRNASLNEKIVSQLTSILFTRHFVSLLFGLSQRKKRQMTLVKVFVSLSQLNKHELTFSLDPRVILCLLRFECTTFQKATISLGSRVEKICCVLFLRTKCTQNMPSNIKYNDYKTSRL